MCLQCHEGFSNKVIEKQLLETLESREFEKFNGTSISHLTLISLGMNGHIAQSYAIEILEEYVKWKKDNTSNLDNNFFGQPAWERIESQLDLIYNFNEIAKAHNLTDLDIRDLFYDADSENGKRVNGIIGNLERYFVNMVDSFDRIVTKKGSFNVMVDYFVSLVCRAVNFVDSFISRIHEYIYN